MCWLVSLLMNILPAVSFLNALSALYTYNDFQTVQNNNNDLSLKTVSNLTEMEYWLSSYECIQYSLQKDGSDEAPLVDEPLETDQGPIMAPRWWFAFFHKVKEKDFISNKQKSLKVAKWRKDEWRVMKDDEE